MTEKRSEHIKSSDGFSLVELMLVVVIMGIAATFIAPSLKSYDKSRSLHDASNSIAGIFRYVQSMSITKGICYKINILQEYPWLILQAETSPLENPGEFTEIGFPSVIQMRSLKACESLKVKEVKAQGSTYIDEISFYPDGSTTSAFCFASNSNSKIYTIALVGATGICMVFDHETESIYDEVQEK